MTRAVVFAYHDVGVRCLAVLLGQGVHVPLVVSHEDDPNETIWFASVARLAADYDIPVITPRDPNTEEVVEQVRALAPDFLFSFYYRHLLQPPLLAIPSRGALNMHGSLLPKYRGRVPVNWAIIHGETQTGASLHYMNAKPDAGDLVDQQAVPILPDDTALDVFRKVTCAAEVVLERSLPALIAGTAPRLPLDLTTGSYFGGRKPEDGRIDWSRPARDIHNLVRAVAPPFPGAFCNVAGRPARLLRTRIADTRASTLTATLYADGHRLFAHCHDGGVLRVLQLEVEGNEVDAVTLTALCGPGPWPLG
ncbi:formyltransferase [Thiobacter aerophilum]|uniref:Formyltransferase n=1 Tax=Thiobacter aerophilum TaxID=3121275 RepID=A0ABV0EBM8_9BURK